MRFDTGYDRAARESYTVSARLKREGLVVSKPYRGVFLTEAGQAMAERSRQRHRLVVDLLLAGGTCPPDEDQRAISAAKAYGLNEALLSRLDMPVPEGAQSLERRPNRRLLCDRCLGHRSTRMGLRQPLQNLRMARAGRQIVADQGIPEREKLLVQIERARVVAGLYRVPKFD